MEKSIKNAIETAIKQCAKDIYEEKVKILCESDFERFLANRIDKIISKKQNIKSDWRVHTHLTHYSEHETFDVEEKIDVYPDICIIKDSEIKSSKCYHKGYVHRDKSYVLEVKYRHYYDYTNLIDKDFEKAEKLLPTDADLYVVVLFDEKYDKNDEKLHEMYGDTLNKLRKAENITGNLQDRLHCFALYKSHPKCNKIG